MSFKGAMNSLSAAQKRSAREAARRERERAKLQALNEKERAYRLAVYEAEDYEAHVTFLVSFHKECRESVDWQEIFEGQEPSPPQEEHFTWTADQIRNEMENYKPGRMDKLLGRDTKQLQELEERLQEARSIDQEAFEQARTAFLSDKESYDLSEGVLRGDPKTYIETLEIASTGIAGLNAGFKAANSKMVEVVLDIEDDSVIPNETKSVLKSGKLSVKKMPVTKYWQLYQDYACSLALRFARETLALLPIDLVLMNVRAPLLNTRTGHKELQTIVSVGVSRSTIEQLNLEMLDPSDAMENFVYRMNFTGRTGFKPVDPLSIADFEDS